MATYFEAAGVITTLILLGQVLELRARSQTSAAIKQLLGLAPTSARRIEVDGSEEDIPLQDVQAIAYESGKLIGVLEGTGGVAAALPALEASLAKKTGAEVCTTPTRST